jgi:hypothetical protein
MTAPFRVDLTAKNVSTPRQLGALADALLSSQSDRVLVSFGENAKDTLVTSTFSRWVARNDRLLRTRAKAIAVVAPSFWIRIQWRLLFLLAQPNTPSTVHETETKARQWLEGVV